MQVFVDCVHCYLKQSVTCMTIAGIDEDSQHRILFEIMDDIKVMERRRTPAENSTEILLKVYELINSADPYREVKKKSNDMALELYPVLREFLDSSGDRLRDALKISVSGNVIDLGINRSFDINASLKHSLNTGFSRDDFEIFSKKLDHAEEVVMVGDNAGEIVFDRLLAEELSRLGKRVTYIVKGGPILNDATMEDAIQSGMNKTAGVITTGSNYLGVPLKKVSGEVKKLLEESSLVISKGQANFESLEHEELARGRVFFLLKIKCESVGKVAGANFGDIVFFTR
ncbi:MAG: damage-control phosphatase ARMT1 family protein [Bacillota bacterium]